MTEYSIQENFGSDTVKISSDLCISLNQSDSVLVHVTLPNNETLSTKFALWNTILDVKRYILPALQPTIVNIQQIKCVLYDGNQQFEAYDHTFLKYYSDDCSVQVWVNIEHYEDIINSPHVPNTTTQKNAVHPDQGNILDTNVIMPKHTLGYRNKKTGKFYINTMVQTSSKPTDLDRQNINSLAIQTISTQDATTEVLVECGTQTQPINVLRSLNIVQEISYRQKMYPDLIEYRDKYARIIQKSVRTWIARKKFENMLKYYYYLKQPTHDEEKNLKNVVYVEYRKAILDLQYPSKTEDFKALFSIVHDNYKISKTKLPTSKKIELLTEKLACLREIEKRRNQAKEIAEDKKILRQLNDISKPFEKVRKNGDSIYIETPETYQAHQFMNLYVALKKDVTSKSERIELLHNLQETLERFKEIDLTKPLIDLITRELTMLNVVQLNNNQLKILRKRIELEFLLILKQPDINPAISRTVAKATVCPNKCYSCRRLQFSNKFVILSYLTNPTICMDCKHLNRITIEKINLLPYKNIMKNIKATEAKLCVKSSLAFFLKAEDIYYLVTIIWKAKSAISESKDIMLLRLVRWNNEKDWSPSNTILLTVYEAYVHSKIHDINKVYSIQFIDQIHQKHVIANKYFKYLTKKTAELDRNNQISKYNNKNK